MRRSVKLRVALFALLIFVSSLIAPVALAANPRTPLTTNTAAAVSALQAKLEAIEIVESMRYPDPDLTPPGKEFRKEYILLELRAAIDGTFRGDNFLTDGSAFDHDVNAAKRLQDMQADPKVDSQVKAQAAEAIEKIVWADRTVTARMIEATQVFGTDIPSTGKRGIEKAEKELAKGDSKLAKGMPVDAIRDYRKAWEYASEAVELIWAAQDRDGDRMIEEIEARLGTDPAKADTDGDGLTDSDEFTLTGTDPTRWDSDGSGLSDGEKDLDGDGLTNREEVAAGTDPLRKDTDGDTLDDRSELDIGTDPRKADTDADGLRDDSELRLGTDPLNPDSDGDGLPDGLEEYVSTQAAPDGSASVELTGMGDVAGTVQLRDVSDSGLFRDAPGRIGAAVDITADAPFSKARVKIQFDPSEVPNGDYDGVKILWYDEVNRLFLPLAESGVNVEKGYAWADTTHFSTFVLFYIPNWQAVWTHPMQGGRDEQPDPKNIDVMIALDSSGSMSSNDRYGYRRIAAKSFIDALIPGDRVGIVDFDYSARLLQALTTDFEAAKSAVDRVDDVGGTDIGAGVSRMNQELIQNGDPDHLKVEILLTDGEGSYSDSYTTQAKENGIVIYTIGLGSSVDEVLLRTIAEQTGGQYYPVASAEDLPQVFQRIVDPGVDLTDSDGDGIPDAIEMAGLRSGAGQLYVTDPNNPDTDGDGIPDGIEAGAVMNATWGDYYSMPSNPTAADSDGDGLLDHEEEEMGLDPYRADTDGDGLNDWLEVNEDFDPTHRNPDGDHRDDYDEWLKGSDPFHYDLSGWDYAGAAVAGFVLGDAGESWANLGWIERETLESFAYVGGWLASGYFAIGDVRDTLASLIRLDLGDTLLNALGLVPLLGDVAKTTKVVAKFLSWSDNLIKPATRWIVRTFADNDDLVFALLKLVGYSDELLLHLSKAEVEQLARSRNSLGEIAKLLRSGTLRMGTKSLSSQRWSRVMSRVNDLWPASRRAEGIAVEAAVELLEGTHDILYVGRPVKIRLQDGTEKMLNVGPDIVAVDRSTGLTVIVEAKGSRGAMSLNRTRLTSKVRGTKYVQPSLDWLRTDPYRYLNVMLEAADPQVQEAGQRLRQVVFSGQAYETVVVASGTSTRWGGRVDEVLTELASGASSVELILLDHP